MRDTIPTQMCLVARVKSVDRELSALPPYWFSLNSAPFTLPSQ